jgi:hypothetical protein
MEGEEKYHFAESCYTIALQKEDLFMSAFPGKVIFGETNSIGFKKEKCFVFLHYQIIHFYLSLLNIVSFFASEARNTDEQGQILSLNSTKFYYWIGKNVISDESEIKIVKFGIQSKDEITYEILLNANELNDLIYFLPQIILSALCLKINERNCLEYLSDQSTALIVSLNQRKKCEKFVTEKLNIDSVIKSNIIDLFLYYNELMLIIHKLKTLYNHDMRKSNIEILIQ